LEYTGTVMLSRTDRIEIAAIDRAEIALESWSWPFVDMRRAEIAQHFAELQRRRPGVWNGRILLMHRHTIHDRVLHGACFETDYANLCAWRDWDFPDACVTNVFAAAALRSADGAYLVGKMAPDTATAGLLYFPCGTPDPSDIDAGGRFDLEGSMRRELLEETGIDFDDLYAEPGWAVVRDRNFLALFKRASSPLDAGALGSQIMGHIAREAKPEFEDIRIVRGAADLDANMPRFMVAFLEHEWRAERMRGSGRPA
jgi:hypothetical protein